MMTGDWLSLKKKEAAAATYWQHKVKEFYVQNSLAVNNLELQVKRCQGMLKKMQKVENSF
jgi:hypothetical protein